MRVANIVDNVVVAIWEVPAIDVYGDLYNLVEVSDDVLIGATYNNELFTNP